MRTHAILIFLWVAWLNAFIAFGEQRFPPPDFESGHQLPQMTTPPPRAQALEYVDVAVLGAALAVSVWLIFRKRSRKGLVALSLFSLIYFGFWRRGCVCAIGSVQNVAASLLDPGVAVPITVLLFFLLPLAVSLFAGRAFCAGVCPHGALQDLVLVKPIKLPAWLDHGLGMIPFFYLGAGVLFAATGSAFLFCQYDPFVPLFRMTGRTLMVLSGVALLLLGVFVGRPYCRFLCPYGALLKIGAVLSRRRVRVTPDSCTQCRLCEHTCPFGAMRVPEAIPTGTSERQTDRRRLTWTLLLLPVLLVVGGWIGWRFAGTAARLHPTVALAERLIQEKDQLLKTGVLSPDDLALERGRQAPAEYLRQAVQIRHKFQTGSVLFGTWCGLVIGLKLLSLSVYRRRTDYEPTPGDCVGCARCFEFCPNELVRRGFFAQPGEGRELVLRPASEEASQPKVSP